MLLSSAQDFVGSIGIDSNQFNGQLVQKFTIADSTLRWLETILTEYIGHAWYLAFTPEGLVLSLLNAQGAIIFDQLQECFTESRSDLPYTQWDAEREGWHSGLGGPLPAPGAANLPTPLIERRANDHVIHYDILGLTYWMLARVEEIDCSDLDHHGRYPATSSHAYRYGYLDRPVVDEWLHVLRQVIQRQWLNLKFRVHESQTFVTCDLDFPYQLDVSNNDIARGIAGDLLKRQNPKLALDNLYRRCRARIQAHRGYFSDQYLDNIDWIMGVNEQVGNRVAFYFITDHTHPRYDTHYRMDDPIIRNLLRRIHDQGHEIGLHPSYNSYLSLEQTQREADILRRTLEDEDISYGKLGGRQHYLRWQTPQTARILEAAGVSYDSTLSFADHPGFRCGTSREFTMYDAVDRRPMKLKQRPLVLMDCSVIDKCYMGMGYTDKAWAYMSMIKKRALLLGGTFTLLWHNSYFLNPEARSYYQHLIKQ